MGRVNGCGGAGRVEARVPFYYTHLGKNILLLVLSLVTAPVSAAIVLASLAGSVVLATSKPVLQKDASLSSSSSSSSSPNRKTILVTGVSMTKGLAIARSLAQHTPHRIIGADISSLSPGRFSNAIAKYYRLDSPHGDDAEPYMDSLLSVLAAESVHLWISCSSVVAAVQDGQVVGRARAAAQEKGRVFEAIQFDQEVVETFHQKDKFIDYIASLNLPIPESYRCTSPDEALRVLLHKTDDDDDDVLPNKHFLAKPIGVDDAARNAIMTLLPLDHDPDKTTHYVHRLNISPQNPFQLQQYIDGNEYCTHALVVRGHVKAFTACPSSELLMHYAPLPASSPLARAMLTFTETVAQDGGQACTGHLSFDFVVPANAHHADEEEEQEEPILYPIESNPRAHTAVVLFDKTPQMADAYLSVLDNPMTDFKTSSSPVFPLEPTKSVFWLGHDLVALGILPLLDALLSGRGSSSSSWQHVVAGVRDLATHVLYWQDGTWTMRDPVPFFVLYHAYWPARFLDSLRKGKRWSRINVSTTKMFDG
ncbi:hypothetical protein ACEQ8H_000038 [Pleosporales sp. CAS-2024a]